MVQMKITIHGIKIKALEPIILFNEYFS